MKTIRIITASALLGIAAMGTALADSRGGEPGSFQVQSHGYVSCQTAQGSTATGDGNCHFGDARGWAPVDEPTGR